MSDALFGAMHPGEKGDDGVLPSHCTLMYTCHTKGEERSKMRIASA